MAEQPTVQEILAKIRDRVRARTPQAASNISAVFTAPRLGYDLGGLRRHLDECRALRSAVGTINPRNPGLHNKLIQLVKKAMARSLGWYTCSIRRFDSAVIGALEVTQAALCQLQSRLEQRFDTERAFVQQQLETHVDQKLESIREQLDNQQRNIDRVAADLAERTTAIEKRQREILQINDTHLGPKARAGLWFNDAVAAQYDAEGHAFWSMTTERIIEKPWLLRHLPSFFPGIRVLDVGCAESLVSLELASNGYQVTGMDVRPYPLRHPNFNFVQGDICHSGLPSDAFDIVIALSSVEHVGLGAYGDPGGESLDQVAIREMRRVLKPGGHLLLTVPFGRPAVTPIHRIYDSAALRTLLRGLEREAIEYGVKMDAKTWITPAAEQDAVLREHDPITNSPGAVALVACRKVVR